jgi:hypothetical protein
MLLEALAVAHWRRDDCDTQFLQLRAFDKPRWQAAQPRVSMAIRGRRE